MSKRRAFVIPAGCEVRAHRAWNNVPVSNYEMKAVLLAAVLKVPMLVVAPPKRRKTTLRIRLATLGGVSREMYPNRSQSVKMPLLAECIWAGRVRRDKFNLGKLKPIPPDSEELGKWLDRNDVSDTYPGVVCYPGRPLTPDSTANITFERARSLIPSLTDAVREMYRDVSGFDALVADAWECYPDSPLSGGCRVGVGTFDQFRDHVTKAAAVLWFLDHQATPPLAAVVQALRYV